MSGLVVFLALLSCVQVATATTCNYQTGLIQPYLTDANLYCFDDDGRDHTVDENSKLCSTEGAFSPRTDGMDVLCGAGFTQVGYSFYPCNAETGVLGPILADDATLTHYTACVAEADAETAVCSGVDSASAGSKLSVDQDKGAVKNVDLVAAEATEFVSYAMKCGDGFGFQAEVTDNVYGYCSGKGDAGNEFTLTGADGCYELCSAEKTNLDGVTLNIDGGDRSGASVEAEVNCPDGFATASTAAEKYSFTCTGKKEEAVANEGVYNCAEGGCPECLAECPANPAVDAITNAGEILNLATIGDVASAASGQTVVVSVTCGEGFSLAAGAEEKYDLQCNSNENDTDASSGKWSFVNDFPVCHPECPANKFAAIENVEGVIIGSTGKEGETVSGVVNCAGGYSLEADVAQTFDFTCTNGEFVAAGDGPQCQKECAIPTEESEFNYYHKDDLENALEAGKVVKPGKSHIKLACKPGANDTTLQLVGPTTMSCNKEGELIADDAETKPFCSDTIVCNAPVVMKGKVNTKNNLEVGGVYTISCEPSHWFSTATVKKYNAGDLSVEGYSETEVECKGEPMDEFKCHFGCLAPDIAGGAIFPDMAEEDAAPYEMGQVVEFKCLDGASITEGKAEATCEPGGIAPAVCGACSFALSLVLSFVMLLTLL